MEEKSCVKNCNVVLRDGDHQGLDIPGGVTLDGYAIVPDDRYKKLVAERRLLRGLLIELLASPTIYRGTRHKDLQVSNILLDEIGKAIDSIKAENSENERE
jgi:hypothetical protein